MFQESTFIHSNSHAKPDKPRKKSKNKNFQRRCLDKKGRKQHFGYKRHSIIDTDYGLIRKSKTTTSLRHDL